MTSNICIKDGKKLYLEYSTYNKRGNNVYHDGKYFLTSVNDNKLIIK